MTGEELFDAEDRASYERATKEIADAHLAAAPFGEAPNLDVGRQRVAETRLRDSHGHAIMCLGGSRAKVVCRARRPSRRWRSPIATARRSR